MASSSGAVSRAVIPSGNNKTGWRIPNTPGSMNAGEDTPLRFTGRWITDADRRTPRTRRQRNHQEHTRTTQPIAQTPRAATAYTEKVLGEGAVTGVTRGGTTKPS